MSNMASVFQFQCQWLTEENQKLKSMLETCRKTIAFLEGKVISLGAWHLQS